ncbi:unnamed protein product [Didymodactylos carnosus]|uniref:Uncharacterized protein n=1 Tax=Didymodactylos carnosus TaxID=1234261 RepID=A0A813TT23_9BILA|nr:unnamed protein product [Didymodactylos carnosus]CAF1507545.1 unnamed protein product [Didymodactylos carnosus]CAF3598533.1 unnamed protein product [Didymodactylos carnosus]CAF4295630.1 unnamed protein product [Didymodactylos carnosus]
MMDEITQNNVNHRRIRNMKRHFNQILAHLQIEAETTCLLNVAPLEISLNTQLSLSHSRGSCPLSSHSNTNPILHSTSYSSKGWHSKQSSPPIMDHKRRKRFHRQYHHEIKSHKKSKSRLKTVIDKQTNQQSSNEMCFLAAITSTPKKNKCRIPKTSTPRCQHLRSISLTKLLYKVDSQKKLYVETRPRRHISKQHAIHQNNIFPVCDNEKNRTKPLKFSNHNRWIV